MVTIHGIKEYLNCLNNEKLIELMGLTRQAMLENEKVTSETHFVCPIEHRVLTKQSGKKIMTLDKTTRYCREQSWYFISRKALNKIMKSNFFDNVKNLKE